MLIFTQAAPFFRSRETAVEAGFLENQKSDRYAFVGVWKPAVIRLIPRTGLQLATQQRPHPLRARVIPLIAMDLYSFA